MHHGSRFSLSGCGNPRMTGEYRRVSKSQLVQLWERLSTWRVYFEA
jgi:hypothetical protein